MTTLERFQRLKRAEEIENAKCARAEGAREQLLSRLKSEHGCASVRDAEEKIKKLLKEKDKLLPQLEKLMENLEEEYGDRLEG